MPQWVLPNNGRNECLDCFVYSYAAMRLFISPYNRNTVWQQLENKFNEGDKVVKPKRATIKPNTNNNFVNSW